MGRKQRFTISTDERIYGPIEIIQSVQYSTRGYVSFRGKIFFLSLFLFLFLSLILDLLSFSPSLSLSSRFRLFTSFSLGLLSNGASYLREIARRSNLIMSGIRR